MNPGEVFSEFWGMFASGLQWLAEQFDFLGDHKWAAAIVVLTLIVRTLLIPLVVKQVKSMRAMQRLQPEMKRLQQKYKKDRQRMNQELMELYKREGVNPLGSCLPLVAQAPVFIAMFYAIRNLVQVPSAWIERLAPEAEETGRSILDLAQDLAIVPAMPFIGIGDLAHNANESVGGWILLILMAATSFVSMRQMSAAQTKQQQRIFQLLPIFFVFILMNFPAALVLYWATQNVYQFVQQTIMLRRHPLPTQQDKAKQDPKGKGKEEQPAPARPPKPPKGHKNKQVRTGKPHARARRREPTKPKRPQ